MVRCLNIVHRQNNTFLWEFLKNSLTTTCRDVSTTYTASFRAKYQMAKVEVFFPIFNHNFGQKFKSAISPYLIVRFQLFFDRKLEKCSLYHCGPFLRHYSGKERLYSFFRGKNSLKWPMLCNYM